MIRKHPRLVYAAVLALSVVAAVGGYLADSLGCSW